MSLNIIDLDNLQMEPQHMVRDLPSGGQRLLQGALGYTATIVVGEVVIENCKLTGAKPGFVNRCLL